MTYHVACAFRAEKSLFLLYGGVIKRREEAKRERKNSQVLMTGI